MIEDIFRNTISRYRLVKKGDKLLLGVSGGPDSIALLHLFAALRKEYRLTVVAVHLNHALRDEATQEEEFVKQVCREHKIKCVSETKEVKKFYRGDSLEQTARSLRFDFFLNCSRQMRIKKIALAHHQDDLIETVLMRLIRGTGLRGLRGFLPQTKFRSLVVIRPLIEVKKKDIIHWLKKQRLSYCIDKSNFEDKFLRNRLRLKVLPLLEELNPQISQRLADLSHSVASDYDFIHSYAWRQYESLRSGETRGGVKLKLSKLKELHPAVFNNVIRIAVAESKGNIRRIERRHIEEIRDLILNRPQGSIVDLPDLSAKKEDNHLFIQALIL